ncbi:MAG TPA: tRNA (adenosine(37)-N6)-threonylcarbamoyltransferase complex dimerization subunit type 1 TsaB [Chthoniobacter sp.]|nr:tRNA (adenosine(37)-N6)-threonylcarbamoyltransferase complex dimerization subunit type 1 TsaB [Chthoniobacter sp.]
MITLAIDTSTPHGSIALLADETLLIEEHFVGDRSHSASLFVALEKARALTDRVDAIAVGLGPGSYAGVRIAIAAAMGLRLAFGARLVGIPSVAALDTAVATSDGATWPTQYIAIGDARRESFYFSRIENGSCVEGPLLATEAELRDRLNAVSLPIYATEPVAQFPQAQIALPSAVKLALLASTTTGIIATDNLEPIYLREPHITQPKARPSFLPPAQL